MATTALDATEYLAQLNDDRRIPVSSLRDQVKAVLAEGFEETMQYGMITYVVPHSIYPDGYHCKPTDAVPYVSLASQKNYMSVYLHSIYRKDLQEAFRAKYAETGKKLDMGACCVRFKKLDDLAVDLILETIGSMTVQEYLSNYEALIPASKKKPKKSA
jgi:hypothetical protein